MAQIKTRGRGSTFRQPVFVHRILCTDTIDERVMQILVNEQRIFDAFADRPVAAEQVDQTFS